MNLESKIPPIIKILTFLIITISLSSIFYILIIKAGRLIAAEKTYVYGHMWSPALAAFITQRIYNIDTKNIGWHWAGFKYQALSYITPALYTLVAYFPVWLIGLGKFGNEEFINNTAIEFGTWCTYLPQSLFICLYIILVGITLFPSACASALGEEIGWRGFLVPELYKITSFGKTSLITGIIWAVWHFPLIIWANYNSGTPTLYALLCFSIMIIGLSFLYTFIRLKTGSIWPAVFLHASHNLFIQRIFDNLTQNTGYTNFFIGEFGIALTIPITCIAIACWINRDKIKTEATYD
jgi:membrane protease YdiL (CAAX protease family)